MKAQLNLKKTNRANVDASDVDRIGLFIDENGITCGIDENGNIYEIGNSINGVKKLIGLLNQSGVNAPILTIKENTLGEVPESEIPASPGQYRLTSVGLFPIGRTIVLFGPASYANLSGGFISQDLDSEDVIKYKTLAQDGTPSHDLLVNTSIIILVYPE